jgi:hypothetical protein
MTVQLVKWEAARQALAEARSVDEIKQIKDTAEAYRAAARVANNHEMEADAIEIRFRAERRLGEIMEEERKSGRLSKGNAGKGRPKKGRVSKPLPIDSPPTLDEAGIDKDLAKRARKAAGIKAGDFETRIGRLHKRAQEGDGRLTVSIERLSTEPRQRMRVVGRPKDWMVFGEATVKLRKAAARLDLVHRQLIEITPNENSPIVVETIKLLRFIEDSLIEWYAEFDPSITEQFQTLASAAPEKPRKPKAGKRATMESPQQEIRA